MLCQRRNSMLLQRSLLKSALKLLEVAAAANSTNTKPQDEVQVIIIGGGLAGLSAASHLNQNGFKRTILLEASQRCGGRINSTAFGDTCCELGAKWIPMDASRYSVYELLNRATGLEKKLYQPNTVVYIEEKNGEQINSRLPNLVDNIFRHLCKNLVLSTKVKNGNVHDLNSVDAYFKSESQQILRTIFSDAEQQPVAREIFKSLFKEFGSLVGCCLEYLNVEHLTRLCSLQKAMYIPTGLDNLLQKLAADINEHNIKTGKPVGRIQWITQEYNGKYVLVGCLDGTLFKADHVICTLPLGVLKQFAPLLFRPLLPKQKQMAINKLGYGSPVKMYLQYNQSVSPWFDKNVRPLWTDNPGKNSLRWLQSIVEITKLHGSNHVLELQIGGGDYTDFEKLRENEIFQEVTKLLRKCLKNPDVPFPATMLASNWSSSTCFLGGRPYFSTESSSADVRKLAVPLGRNNQLLFAGDATSVNGFGTIDGARKSGIREAERIVSYYRHRAA